MAALSIFLLKGISVLCANPIHLTDVDLRDGGAVNFEVLEDDSESLKPLIGKPEQFLLDSSHGFWGELLKLERCDSTIPSLCLLEKPVMRGVLRIHKMIDGQDYVDPN